VDYIWLKRRSTGEKRTVTGENIMLITPWNRVLPEKLTHPQVVEKFLYLLLTLWPFSGQQ
jgi:hypothetical protein